MANHASPRTTRLYERRRDDIGLDEVERVFAQVAARQQALQIRHYIGEVRATPGVLAGRAFDGDRDAWAMWALAVAAKLDPLAWRRV